MTALLTQVAAQAVEPPTNGAASSAQAAETASAPESSSVQA
jgi:hypothetical protein